MSIRIEQYWALQHTRRFLVAILSNPHKHWTAKSLKCEASRCLKHFPPLTRKGEPMFSIDTIGDPENDS